MPKLKALRIEVKSKVPDARSVSRRGFFNSLGISGKVTNVEIVDCYTINASLNKLQIQKACELLANSVTQTTSLTPNTQNLKPSFDFALEISFLPGVTDNIGNTAKETIADGTGYKFSENENIYSSQVFLIKLNRSSANNIKTIADSLYNPLIQKATVLMADKYKQQKGFLPNLPLVKLTSSNKVLTVDLNISEKQLADLGKLGIKDNQGRRGPLALEIYQLKAIRDYFNKIKRKPTDIELETLAQTWSEHCKHIIFTSPIDNIKEGLYKHYIKKATETVRKQKGKNDFCVSVFSDNSGAIAFDQEYLVTHKVETHNTPSALDPFGGSLTGIVGVNRDALGFGLGGKPIINTYGFCLAEPTDETELYRDAKMNSKMLSARRIMDGVVAGINAGGNQSGIPTPLGFLYFDPRFRGKPLVFAGTVGLIPRLINGKPSHRKKALNGDLIVMLGGRVGLDGIHGATFSSEGLSENSPSTAVQIGDPITQKKFTDAIVKEARGLYNSITDCGAGGLSSAVGEMAEQSGGCEVNLDKVPTKYPGLAPWQIWISESQERMVLAIPKKNWRIFNKLLNKRGVESSVIGKFTSSGRCIVKFGQDVVMDLELKFLHNGMPKKYLKTKRPNNAKSQSSLLRGGVVRSAAVEVSLQSKYRDSSSHAKASEDRSDALGMTPEETKSTILNLLKSSNITSTAFLANQYDHEVQGTSVTKPLVGKGRVNADAAVTRPLLMSSKGVVLSSALYPEYSESDPYYMAGLCIDSAIKQAVCAGADPDKVALLDNLCWCSPKDPEKLWQLKMAAKGCYDFAVAFGTPFISGKDSMYNDFKGFLAKGGKSSPIKISIPPTLLISAIGIMDNITNALTLDVKQPGDLVYLLGAELKPKKYSNILQNVGILKSNAKKNLAVYKKFFKATQNNLISSAISVSRGGLITSLCKMAIAGQLGVDVNLSNFDFQSFTPQSGLIIATVSAPNIEKFRKHMKGHPFKKIGIVTKEPVIKMAFNNQKISIPLSRATFAYNSTFKNF